jgi:hypothetical protein
MKEKQMWRNGDVPVKGKKQKYSCKEPEKG